MLHGDRSGVTRTVVPNLYSNFLLNGTIEPTEERSVGQCNICVGIFLELKLLSDVINQIVQDNQAKRDLEAVYPY